MAVRILKHVRSSIPNSLFLSQFSTSTPDHLISTIVSLLTHHRSKSRWTHLLSLCPSGFTPSQFSRIALDLKNNPHLVLRFFSFTQRKSLCKHDFNSYATVIHILSRGRLTAHAQNVIRVAIRLREPNPVMKLFEVLVKTYRECGSAPFVFDLLIKCCLEVKKVEICVDIVRMLMSRGLSVKVCTCNALIWESSRWKGVNFAYETFREVFRLDYQESKSSGKDLKMVVRVRPNVHTYNALMVCFYREGLLERVKDIWVEMEGMGCKGDSYSFGVLMAVLCQEGRMRDAEKLWEEMRDKGVEHDAVVYNTIIDGFCKIGEIWRAEEFFREMELSGVESNCVTFEHLVNGYCRVGDVDSAILVYNDMCRKDFRPEVSTVEVLIRGLYDRRRIFEALEILRLGVEKFGVCPTKKSYMFLIKGLCKEQKLEEALKFQAEMVGKGFEPSLEIYNAFIDGYLKQGNVEVANMLRKEMLETQMRHEEV